MDASSGRPVITLASRLGLGLGRLFVGLGFCVTWAVYTFEMTTFRPIVGSRTDRFPADRPANSVPRTRFAIVVSSSLRPTIGVHILSPL